MVVYSVDGASGVMELTGPLDQGSQVLADVDVSECEITFTMDWTSGADGNLDIEVPYRAAADMSTFYKALFTVELDSLGVDTVTGVTVSNESGVMATAIVSKAKTLGVPFNVKVRSSTNQFLKTWSSNTAEPAGWDLITGGSSDRHGLVGFGALATLNAPSPTIPTITPNFIAGFEEGTIAGFVAAGGVAARKYFNAADNIGITAAGGGRDGVGYAARWNLTNSSGYCTISPTQYGAGVQSMAMTFYFNYQVFPNTDSRIYSAPGSVGSSVLFMFRNSDDRIILDPQNGGTIRVGPVLTQNTWYRVDLSWVSAGGNLTIQWSIDGVTQTTATCTTGGNPTLGEMAWGPSSGSQTVDLLVDDIIMGASASSYPIGPVRVVGLVPEATITEEGAANALARFTSNGAGLDATFNAAQILAAISEKPPTIGATATGIYQRTSDNTAFAVIPMSTVDLQSVNAVLGMRAVICGWATGSSNNVQIEANVGGADTSLFTGDPTFNNSTTAPNWLCVMYNPGAWSQAALDAFTMKFGGSSDIVPPPGAHGIYSEVAVTDYDVEVTVIEVLFDDFECCALEVPA